MRPWEHPDFARRLVAAAVVAAVVIPLILWPVYGGSLVWPGLVGNFTASLIAFLCALAWDRREKQRARVAEEEDYARRVDEAQAQKLNERQKEARRRFALILQELRVNSKSFEDASGSLTNRIVLPQLLGGSWVASGTALGAIASDYELVAHLSTFYGRVRELQWRLRRRLELTDALEKQVFDGMTEPLIVELKAEVDDLIRRVAKEAESPSVIEVPFISPQTVVYAPSLVHERHIG